MDHAVVSQTELEEDVLLFVKPDGRDISDRVESGSDDQENLGYLYSYSSLL